MTRVKLTPSAAARFPDIANRIGTVVGTSEGWHRVMWDGIGYAWIRYDDLEPLEPEPTP